MHLLFAALLLGHWLVAGDIHVIPGSTGSAPSGYGSDTNWALFDSTIAAMRRADSNPSVVILTGDFLAHHFPKNVPLAEQTMARIVRAFDTAFPHAQFVVVPGNNDDPCGDYRATPGRAYFKYIAHLWAPLVNRNGAAPQFERSFAQFGWYSARLPLSGVRVIALDTVYWSIVYHACSNVHPTAPQQQLRWLAARLRDLPGSSRAMLVMHIPPGVDAKSTLLAHRLLVVPYWAQSYDAAFTRVVQNDRDRITFAIGGHEHRNDFRAFGGVAMLIAPSVSPVYRNNPAFLLLDMNAQGLPSDYHLVAYDEDSGTWSSAGSFDRVFGVHEFSVSALQSIHDRLRTDEALREQWGRFFVSASGRREITSATWRTYWCAQTQLAGAFIKCAGLQDRVQVLPIAAGVGVAAILVLLALLAVRLGRARRRT